MLNTQERNKKKMLNKKTFSYFCNRNNLYGKHRVEKRIVHSDKENYLGNEIRLTTAVLDSEKTV